MILSKKLFNYFLILVVLQSLVVADCCTTVCSTSTDSSCNSTDSNMSKNLWQPRSFGSYKFRDICMIQAHEKIDCDWGITWAMGMEYMKSFGDGDCRLGALPFWSGTNTMTIGNADGLSDLDGYQFGLGDVTTAGSITLTPEVQHVGADFSWSLLQCADQPGFYCRAKLPVGAMTMKLNVSEKLAIITQSEIPWERYNVLSTRYTSIAQALASGDESQEPDYVYGRLLQQKQSVVRLGDLEMAAGYNIYNGDKGYFGLGFKVTAPVGNAPKAEYMLEPIFGRAGHWAVGGEVHGTIHVKDSDKTQVDLHFRGDVFHLYNGRQGWRSFDLKLNGAGSKYLLVQQYKTKYVIGPNLTTTPPAAETVAVSGGIIPAINITTMPVVSSFQVEGSAALMLNFKRDNWNFALGGEIWGRSCEKLEINDCLVTKFTNKDLNDFAVLGRQRDRDDRFVSTATNNQATIQLCEPLATINKAEAVVLATGTAPSGPAVTPVTTAYDATKVKDAKDSTNRIPALLSDALDIAGAQASRVLTGCARAELGYSWNDNDNIPHLGIFGGVEIAEKASRFVNFWSVGIVGSLQF